MEKAIKFMFHVSFFLSFCLMCRIRFLHHCFEPSSLEVGSIHPICRIFSDEICQVLRKFHFFLLIYGKWFSRVPSCWIREIGVFIRFIFSTSSNDLCCTSNRIVSQRSFVFALTAEKHPRKPSTSNWDGETRTRRAQQSRKLFQVVATVTCCHSICSSVYCLLHIRFDSPSSAIKLFLEATFSSSISSLPASTQHLR